MLKSRILLVSRLLVFSAMSCDMLKKSKDVFLNKFRISTPSMSPTLEIGEIYSVITMDSFKVNQIVAYHPSKKWRNENETVWVHRLVGKPGDVIEMRNGVLSINKAMYSYSITLKHSYVVQTSSPLDEKKIQSFEHSLLSLNTYRFFATPEEIVSLKANPEITEVFSLIAEEDVWEEEALKVVGTNKDNWGPLRIPKHGDKVLLTESNLKQYETLITEHEHQAMPAVNDEYTIKEDYYFVLGDNRHNALDSRFTGFIPQHDMVGVMVVNK